MMLGTYIDWCSRPTLAISALDDPIVSGDCLPYSAVRASSHMILAGVAQGGHLGSFDSPSPFGPDRHRRWHVRPTIEFLRGVIKDLPKSASEQKLGRVQVEEREGGWSWVGDVGWKLVGEEEECGWVGNGICESEMDRAGAGV